MEFTLTIDIRPEQELKLKEALENFCSNNFIQQPVLKQCSVGSSLPPDIAEKILRVRDNLIVDDYSEAWHWLYSIASPEFDKTSDDVWTDLETAAGRL